MPCHRRASHTTRIATIKFLMFDISSTVVIGELPTQQGLRRPPPLLLPCMLPSVIGELPTQQGLRLSGFIDEASFSINCHRRASHTTRIATSCLYQKRQGILLSHRRASHTTRIATFACLTFAGIFSMVIGELPTQQGLRRSRKLK